MNKDHTRRRNLFEIENARNLTREELVRTFIPTSSFWRLLSAKHHILLGARGQGKTAIAKMLSFDHLSSFAKYEPKVKQIIDNQDFIGIYLPTRREWVGSLRNKSWLNENDHELLFQWRMNISSCIAFIPIAISCIRYYVSGIVNQAKYEQELGTQLTRFWLGRSDEVCDLEQLCRKLKDVDFELQRHILEAYISGKSVALLTQTDLTFGTDVFTPLKFGIRKLSELIGLHDNCAWLLCLDEAEYLDASAQRIINSYMRAFPDNLFLKMTTMPYRHHTLATNLGIDLISGHDFEYIPLALDKDKTAKAAGESATIGTYFGRSLFKKIFEESEQFTSDHNLLTEFLGESEILDASTEDWSMNSRNMHLLNQYASAATISRANKLLQKKPEDFGNAIGRKIQGALLLKDAVKKNTGNSALKIYSGATMAIRCSDDNPRRLISLFNQLLLNLTSKQKSKIRQDCRKKGFVKHSTKNMIPQEKQTRSLIRFSEVTLKQIRSIEIVGPELYEFILMIGNYMHHNFHDKELTTDQQSSVELDSSITDDEKELIKAAVGQGLLIPNIDADNYESVISAGGEFQLAYVLAPYFRLYPRKGKSVKLNTVKRYKASGHDSEMKQLQLFEDI